jgi:glycosidase
MHEQRATINSLKLAFTFLMALRGTPCIYYGDEIAMPGANDPDNRHDFPGGWKGDPRSAFEASGRTPQESAVLEHVQKLTALRAKLEPLRRGNVVELVVGNSVWAFARESAAGTVIIAINNGAASAAMAIPYKSDGLFKSQLGVTADLAVRDGHGTVLLPPHSAEIYVKR